MKTEQQNQLNRWTWITIIALSVFAVFWLIYGSIIKANARELNPSIYDTEFLICDNSDPYAVYGYNSAIYLYDDFYTRNTDDTINYSYWYWYGDSYLTTVDRWGFTKYNYDIIKGHLYNAMNVKTAFWISRENTVNNINLKEIQLDDTYLALYFMDSNHNYYVYVSYVPQNSETIQPDYPFDDYTIDANGHFVEQDALYRELYVWNDSTNQWNVAAISSSNVIVNTILKYKYGIKLMPNADVHILNSKFLLDEQSTTPTPTTAPMTSTETFIANVAGFGYVLVDIHGSDLFAQITAPDTDTLRYVQAYYGSTNDLLLRPFFFNYTLTGSGYNNNNSPFIFIFTGSNISLDVYFLTAYNENFDYDYYRQNYTPLNFTPTTTATANLNDTSGKKYIYSQLEGNGLTSCSICFKYGYNNSSAASVLKTSFIDYGFHSETSTGYGSGGNIGAFNTANPYGTGPSYLSFTQLACRLGFLGSPVEPTPDPNAPSPTPTPTEAPHVIITLPTGTPTPTPFMNLPIDPPSGGDLNPDTTEHIFEQGTEYIRNWTSDGILTTAFSFVPGELQFLIWFLVFILIILAVIKLIIHFGG